MQPESEIDIPLPSADVQSNKNPGQIISVNSTQLNLLSMRVKLGRVKDQVYHLLYSNRAPQMQAACKRKNIPGPEAQLQQWFSQIPAEFGLTNLSNVTDPLDRLQLFKLHLEYYSTFIAVHGAFSPNADWVKALSSLGRIALQESAISLLGRHKADCVKQLRPPSAEAWIRCVDLGQECLKNFSWAIETDPSIWYVGVIIVEQASFELTFIQETRGSFLLCNDVCTCRLFTNMAITQPQRCYF